MKPRLCPLGSSLVLGLFLLAGCVTRPPGEAANSQPSTGELRNPSVSHSPSLSPAQRSEAYARFATGYSYELNDQTDRAFQEYQKSAQIDPRNEVLVVEVARHLLQKKEPQQALTLLSHSTALPGADGALYAWTARADLAVGKTNEAVLAAQEAIKRSPEELDGYESLFQIYHTGERSSEALEVLDRAAKVKRADGPFLLGLAQAYEFWLKSSPKDAPSIKPKVVALLKRAAAEEFDEPAQKQRLADLLMAHGESRLAATLYLGLLDEFDETPALRDAIREKLASIYLQTSDRKKAAQQLEAIVRDNPTRYPQAYYFLGTIARENKEFEKAANYFSRLVVIAPDLEQAYYDLAFLKITLDKPAEALQVLAKARGRFPENFVVEFLEGIAANKSKNYGEAVRHFNAAEVIAAASDPKRLNAEFYFEFGAACERDKRFGEAEANFLKSIKIDSEFAEALNYLGYMWADRNEKLERAREFIEKAVKLQPKNGAYLDSLGWVLFRLKEYDAALNYELKAVENISEPDASLYDHLGDIYGELKSREKAVAAWRKSVEIEESPEVKLKIQNHSGSGAP